MFISKKKNGYYYLFYRDSFTGKSKAISTKARTKIAAQSFMDDFKQSTKDMSPKLPVLMYLDDFKTEVLKHLLNNVSKPSLEIYRKTANDFSEICGNIQIGRAHV
jgi:ribosomal protein S8